MLRVAHLTPTFFSKNSVMGGGERYVFNLVQALNTAIKTERKNVSQVVFAMGDDDKIIRHEDIEIRILKNISPYPHNMDCISEKLWQELDHFDLVHIYQSLTIFGAFTTAVASSKKIPIVSTDLGGGNSELMLYGKGLELSNLVISISNYGKSLLNANFSGNHKVVIGPVDTDFFAPAKSTNRNRDRATALCVSRILPHKGIDRVISALPEDMKLLIVGQAYDSNYLSLLKKLSQHKDVKFIHDADDNYLLTLYQTSGVFIQASTHIDYYGNTSLKPELMGLTTLEAMSCGLSAIVSNAGSLPELVPDSRFGLVFSSHEELTKIFYNYMKGNWPHSDSEELAREYVTKNFSFSSVGNLLLKLYQQTLDSA